MSGSISSLIGTVFIFLALLRLLLKTSPYLRRMFLISSGKLFRLGMSWTSPVSCHSSSSRLTQVLGIPMGVVD